MKEIVSTITSSIETCIIGVFGDLAQLWHARFVPASNFFVI